MSRKITISKINILIAMILLLALGVQPAAAAGERGSLEIYYHGVGPDGGQTELSGAEFWLFPAGTRERGGWKLREEFGGQTVYLTEMNASAQRSLANRLYETVVRESLRGEKEVTDGSGRALFEGLEEGLYLAACKEDTVCGDGVFRSAPFLVSIPEQDQAGGVIYNVTVEPKNEWVTDEPEQTPVPTGKPHTPTAKPVTPSGTPLTPDGEPDDGGYGTDYGGGSGSGGGTAGQKGAGSKHTSNVKTGDETPVMFYAVMLTAGLAGTAGFYFMKRRREQQ